jgi:TatA/E family protein of Tat protein translocase
MLLETRGILEEVFMGAPEIIGLILLGVVLFGASRLPQIGKNLGQGIKQFKTGLGEAKEEISSAIQEEKPKS